MSPAGLARPARWLLLAWLASAAGGCRCQGLPVEPGRDAGQDGGPPDAGPAACPPPYSDAGLTLAASLDAPRRLAVDEAYVYATEPGELLHANGTVLRIPLDGGAAQELADGGLEMPDAVAADDAGVFVVDGYGLWRIDKASLQARLIDPVQSSAAADTTEVRLTGQAAVVATGLRWLTTVGKDGTGHRDLYAGDAGTSVRGVTVEQGQAYFLVTGDSMAGLYQVPLDGSAPAQRVRAEPAIGRALLLTPTDFIWAEGAPGSGRIRRAPRDGGLSEDLATGLLAPSRLALVGTTLYFKDATGSDAGTSGFFRLVDLCAPGASAPVGPEGYGPGDVAYDGQGLYYCSQGGPSAGYVARLR